MFSASDDSKLNVLISQTFLNSTERDEKSFNNRNILPFSIHLQIRADGQCGRCSFQGGGVNITFKMRCEEECCAVEFGKGVRSFDDGVAQALKNGDVDRVEDGVLEDDFSDVVLLVCGIWFSRGAGGHTICNYVAAFGASVTIPRISSMDITAASS